MANGAIFIIVVDILSYVTKILMIISLPVQKNEI